VFSPKLGDMSRKFDYKKKDPHTKMLSFCDNKYFPSWKDDVLGVIFQWT
jgi:hypothetical protein